MNASTSVENVRVEALLSLVTDEFMEQVDLGEQPDIEEYASRHPQIAAVLRNDSCRRRLSFPFRLAPCCVYWNKGSTNKFDELADRGPKCIHRGGRENPSSCLSVGTRLFDWSPPACLME
jgi:hypothetical protein